MSTPTPNTLAVRNPFGEAITTPDNASAHALAQREVGEVQAAMVIAQRFPRDPIRAVDRILAACSRPTLAERAVYEYARDGQAITGPSIRLAEEIARCWGNMLSGVTELSRGNGSSECLAYAWDLETNYRDEKRFQVKHWRDTKGGGYAITEERDIYEHIANLGARRKRACILAIIPTDVQEAALDQCEETLKAKVNVTPERIKSLVEKFGEFGVTLEQIETRIQRRVDTITPALMLNLGRIYTSLKDGMSNPEQWFPSAPAVKKPLFKERALPRPEDRDIGEDVAAIAQPRRTKQAPPLTLEGQTEEELAAENARLDAELAEKEFQPADQDGYAE